MVLEGSPHKSIRPFKPAAIPGILLECAFGAVVQGFMVLLMGGVAVSILGGLLHDKIPSLPLGLGESMNPGANSVAAWNAVWSVVKANRLWIISMGFFAHAIWSRFSPHMETKTPSRGARRLGRAFNELSSNWFGLLVGNAFGATITAMLVILVGNFSLSKILLHTLLGGIADALMWVGGTILSAGAMDAIRGLCSWYGANQFKFTFWILFLGAMLDDLGLPNFKTLGRWLWRRFCRSGRPGPPPPLTVTDQDPPSATPPA
jgi:hypothetical protein